MAKYAVQGNSPPPRDVEASWYSAVDQRIQDALIQVPRWVASPAIWGRSSPCQNFI